MAPCRVPPRQDPSWTPKALPHSEIQTKKPPDCPRQFKSTAGDLGRDLYQTFVARKKKGNKEYDGRKAKGRK